MRLDISVVGHIALKCVEPLFDDVQGELCLIFIKLRILDNDREYINGAGKHLGQRLVKVPVQIQKCSDGLVRNFNAVVG